MIYFISINNNNNNNNDSTVKHYCIIKTKTN